MPGRPPHGLGQGLRDVFYKDLSATTTGTTGEPLKDADDDGEEPNSDDGKWSEDEEEETNLDYDSATEMKTDESLQDQKPANKNGRT